MRKQLFLCDAFGVHENDPERSYRIRCSGIDSVMWCSWRQRRTKVLRASRRLGLAVGALPVFLLIWVRDLPVATGIAVVVGAMVVVGCFTLWALQIVLTRIFLRKIAIDLSEASGVQLTAASCGELLSKGGAIAGSSWVSVGDDCPGIEISVQNLDSAEYRSNRSGFWFFTSM